MIEFLAQLGVWLSAGTPLFARPKYGTLIVAGDLIMLAHEPAPDDVARRHRIANAEAIIAEQRAAGVPVERISFARVYSELLQAEAS